MPTRLRTVAFRLLVALLLSSVPATARAQEGASGWAQMDVILRRIVAPVFPDREFPVTQFGAVGDGKTDTRAAIAAAIDACHAAGGGRVVVPAGVYLCDGPVHLKSNVNLHLSEGATLKFGTDPADYLPVVLTRWEGTLLHNYSPLIYARGQTNIAVTGRGVIDGSGRAGFGGFRKRELQEPDRALIRKMGAERVPVEKRVFGAGHYLRPSAVSPYECTNVLIEGVTLRDLPFWAVHPVFCRNVTIRGITVESTIGNNDGVDPDSCTDLLIEDCIFRNGDDAVAIKSGRDQDGWDVNRPCENIIVRRCSAENKFYALAIGSEMSGGVRNVFLEDCTVLFGRAAVYIKANLDRGGVVENVYVRRVRAEHVTEALVRFETSYHGYRGEDHPPLFRNFVIEEVSAKKSDGYAIYAEGVPASPVREVELRDVVVDQAREPMWLKHIDGFRFESVRVGGKTFDGAPEPTPDGVEKLSLRL